MAATILLSAVLLYLAVHGVNWREFIATIKHAKLGLLAVAFGMSHVSMVLRSLRWRVLLSAEKKVAPLTVFWATMAGYLGNNFLPARAGEVIRSAALGHKAGMSKSWVFATALTERLLDVVALVLFSLAAVLSLGRSSQWLIKAWKVMGIVGVAGVIILLAAPLFGGCSNICPARLVSANGCSESSRSFCPACGHSQTRLGDSRLPE